MATEIPADALGEKGKSCVVPVAIKEWGVTTGFPHKTRLLDPVQSAPAVEYGAYFYRARRAGGKRRMPI